MLLPGPTLLESVTRRRAMLNVNHGNPGVASRVKQGTRILQQSLRSMHRRDLAPVEDRALQIHEKYTFAHRFLCL
jgi:hypothetical protein